VVALTAKKLMTVGASFHVFFAERQLATGAERECNVTTEVGW